MLSKLKHYLMRCKIYIDRTWVYVGLAKGLMTLLIFLKLFGFEMTVLNSIIVIITGTGSLILLGWIDIHVFKLFKSECEQGAEINPVTMQILNDLKEIKKELKKQ